MRLSRILPAALGVAALTLTACGGGIADSTSTASLDSAAPAGDVMEITVGASPVPHAEILQFVQDNLSADAGLNITIVEYTDYVQPNVALSEGELDANYFQHVPYFDAEVDEKGYDFQHSVGIHIEPLGVYSDSVQSLDDLADGATIAVTNDPSNQARALQLLEDNALFTLDGVDNPTIYDVVDNPRNFEFTELNPEQLTVSLPDVDLAVINGNFALDAGLVPAEDAIVLESGEGNPYSNIVAYRTESADDPAVQLLVELLTSDETRAFIEQNWPNGEVIPAF